MSINIWTNRCFSGTTCSNSVWDAPWRWCHSLVCISCKWSVAIFITCPGIAFDPVVFEAGVGELLGGRGEGGCGQYRTADKFGVEFGHNDCFYVWKNAVSRMKITLKSSLKITAKLQIVTRSDNFSLKILEFPAKNYTRTAKTSRRNLCRRDAPTSASAISRRFFRTRPLTRPYDCRSFFCHIK